jgi:L-aspartate semialdehyde sulfurtransferase
MTKSIDEINKRIKCGDALVLTAEEMIDFVEKNGVKKAAKEVDVVTTGTFGAMCSSGALLNFGHSEPPINMKSVWLNDVSAYAGLAAVDAYIGATQLSESEGINYGGGHVIEDLVKGEDINLRASSQGTDCYPRKRIETSVSIDQLNQAVLLNPRNCYQNYAAATNSSDNTIYTYMGKLAPSCANVNYTTSSQLSPLINDPYLETIGIGSRIFLAGTEGYVINEGTQNNTNTVRKNGVPIGPGATLSVQCNLKNTSSEFLKGASFKNYGVSLYVGLGIPIPILNEEIAKRTAIKDSEIFTEVYDYSVGSRNRPSLKRVSYAELRSGRIELDGKDVKTSSLASLSKARKVAGELKSWISEGRFFLSNPVSKIPEGTVRPLHHDLKIAKEIMKKAVIASSDKGLQELAGLMIKKNTNHVVIIDAGKLKGIVTSWDIARAVAEDKDIVGTNKTVVTASPMESVGVIAERLRKHDISALPIVDEKGNVMGIVSSEDVSKFMVNEV